MSQLLRQLIVLFLDYDGPMHPHNVIKHPRRGIVLECEGHHLFEHAQLLSDLLTPHPEVNIVLSTSWVQKLGYKRARSFLPPALQARVIGATYHSAMDTDWWNSLTRFEQIENYVRRHRPYNWLAVDDDAEGWPADKEQHLVHCDQYGGIGEIRSQERLTNWLSGLREFENRVRNESEGNK